MKTNMCRCGGYDGQEKQFEYEDVRVIESSENSGSSKVEPPAAVPTHRTFSGRAVGRMEMSDFISY